MGRFNERAINYTWPKCSSLMPKSIFACNIYKSSSKIQLIEWYTYLNWKLEAPRRSKGQWYTQHRKPEKLVSDKGELAFAYVCFPCFLVLDMVVLLIIFLGVGKAGLHQFVLPVWLCLEGSAAPSVLCCVNFVEDFPFSVCSPCGPGARLWLYIVEDLSAHRED